MNEQIFIEKFVEQLEGTTEKKFSMQTEFRKIDVWDSLTGLAVQVMISEDFGGAIPDDEFIAAKTIGDLYLLAQKHKRS